MAVSIRETQPQSKSRSLWIDKLIYNGVGNPYRYRVRPPSLINLTTLEDMCLGHTVADVMVILGSVDIVVGEVDR
jgi:NADH-quinone oxidoreductase subunit D